MVDIDETIIDNTTEKVLDIIPRLIEAVVGKILGGIGNILTNRGNNIGILIMAGVIGLTAYMVIRKAQTG